MHPRTEINREDVMIGGRTILRKECMPKNNAVSG